MVNTCPALGFPILQPYSFLGFFGVMFLYIYFLDLFSNGIGMICFPGCKRLTNSSNVL